MTTFVFWDVNAIGLKCVLYSSLFYFSNAGQKITAKAISVFIEHAKFRIAQKVPEISVWNSVKFTTTKQLKEENTSGFLIYQATIAAHSTVCQRESISTTVGWIKL